jgi:4-hydroxythreonine-4-phosphate dehydrogenase
MGEKTLFKPTVGITMGDPAGIGPEVIVKALKGRKLQRQCLPLVIGAPVVMRRAGGEGLSIVDCGKVDLRKLRPGRVSRSAGQAAAAAIRTATQMALAGQLAAVVTAPVCKQALHLAGHPYPGQTEFLAAITKTRRFTMMLAGQDLRVVLVTTHLPLSRVSGAITIKRVLDTILLAHWALQVYFAIKHPRVAVCALNPHAGDGGIFGDQEERIIAPAIREASRRGVSAHGPYPADTLFAPPMRRKGDVFVAMYHDQGLIPIKMGGFGTAVNITLGLPIIRTSPDHGTAFQIAGQGKANPASMIRAIQLAVQLAKARREASFR